MLVADARFRFPLRNCNFEFRGIVSHISSTFSGRCAGDIFGVPKMGRILQNKNIFWGPRNGPVSGPEMGPFWGPEMGPSLLISNWGAHFWTLKWAHFWPPKWAHFWDPKIYFFAELYRCLGPHITFPGPKPCLQSRAFHIFLPRTLFSEGLRLCWFVCRGGDIGMPYHALSLCCQRCITPNMDV